MTMKDILLEFFKTFENQKGIVERELNDIFNVLTDYKYTTPTAYNTFKGVLVNSSFIIRKQKNVYRFVWEKIYSRFPELVEDKKGKRKR